VALRICLLWTCLYFNTYAFSPTGCSGTEFKSENIGIVLGMILVSILLGIPVGLFYIVLMRSTRFFVKVCVLEICTLADTNKYTNTHAHTHRNTLVYVRARVRLCVTRTLSHKLDTFLHSYTNANKPAQTHVHEHIYLYKHSYWIIFMRLTYIHAGLNIHT